MLRRDIYKNWILQNENWESYLLRNNVLLHSCLLNIPLEMISKLFCN